MANADECATAIGQLATRLAGPGDPRTAGLDRAVSAEVTDLGLTFYGHLHDGVLDEISTTPQASGNPAQIRLTLTSDDLVALASGALGLGSAWLSGRVKIAASLTDMLRLRSMI